MIVRDDYEPCTDLPGSDDEDGDVGANASAHSSGQDSTDVDDIVPVPVQPPLAVPEVVDLPPAPPAAFVGPRRARVKRTNPWGPDDAPFGVAPIAEKGVCVIGMGATCFLHSNSSDEHSRMCKKALTFGAEGVTPDEATIRVKRWLIRGLQLDPNLPDCRSLHRDIDARRDCAAGPPAEDLDATVARDWAVWQRHYGWPRE